MADIIGRKAELAILQSLYDSHEPELVAVYGRRRIGKTFLIDSFFHDKAINFELTGIKDVGVATQLKNFADVYSEVFEAGRPIKRPATWFDAFTLLRKRVEKKAPGEKIILFLDELPWLASPRSMFLPALDHTWNRYLSRLENIIVIVCGSAASWMIKKILHDRGGLHGRLTQTIQLLPFTLEETRLYLESQQVKLPPQQLIELYMAVGGVAKYLSKMPAGKSVNQLIQNRYFDKDAPLRGEFHKLFSSLFDDYAGHLAIVEALAASHYGLSYDQLLKRTGLTSGGGLSTMLTELRESGFITLLRQFGKKKKAAKYLLTDEFTLFYVKWVREWENELQGMEGHWQQQANTQSFRTWAGYAFETLCVKNIVAIKKQLGISGVTARVSQWREEDTQIDLVIDRADNCIHLCEIKFHDTELALTAADAENLERKKARFSEATKTPKALFTTLITINGVAKNPHYIHAVDCHIQAEEFF